MSPSRGYFCSILFARRIILPVPSVRTWREERGGEEGVGELYCFYQVNNCACHACLKRWERSGGMKGAVFGRSVDVEFYAPITNVGHK